MRHGILLSFFCMTALFSEGNNRDGVVSVQLNGQFGNQLFEVAAGYAYALDHNLAFTVPDLIHKTKDNIPYNAEKFFLSKVDSYDMPGVFTKWKEPTFNYTEIPDSNAIELEGFFQSDKYFKHHRSEILELFKAPEGLLELILSKYPFLDSDAPVVGIQIRDYRVDKMYGKAHPTIGRNYYEKAMREFPENTIFLVSSNNKEFARECTQGLSKNIIYLSAGYLEEFYTLTLCKSFIISNSSFGWWAAWLSRKPNKTVILPSPWFALPYNNEEMTRDLFPEGWKIIQTKASKRPK